MTPAPLLFYLASLALRLYAAVTRPSQAQCPHGGWWLGTGVQRDGSFTCRLDHDAREWPPLDGKPDAVLSGRIYCRAEEQAVVVTFNRVACRRKGARK